MFVFQQKLVPLPVGRHSCKIRHFPRDDKHFLSILRRGSFSRYIWCTQVEGNKLVGETCWIYHQEGFWVFNFQFFVENLSQEAEKT